MHRQFSPLETIVQFLQSHYGGSSIYSDHGLIASCGDKLHKRYKFRLRMMGWQQFRWHITHGDEWR